MFNGYGGFVEDDEKFLGIDSSDGYPPLWIYLTPLNCTLVDSKNEKILHFVFFYHNKPYTHILPAKLFLGYFPRSIIFHKDIT